MNNLTINIINIPTIIYMPKMCDQIMLLIVFLNNIYNTLHQILYISKQTPPMAYTM